MTAPDGRPTSKRPHVPAYRERKPSGQARVTIDDKQIYPGRFGTPKSREKYNQRVAERIATPSPTTGGMSESSDQNLTVVENR